MVQRTLVKRDERTPGLNWHQDAAFFRGRCRALNVWTALTPCGEQCPGLSVIPTRLETVLDPEHRAHMARSERTISVVERLTREIGVASPRFEPGDAILFDEMTLHRTSARRWNVPFRDVAITWFFAPSRFPAHGEPLAL
jgi:ectoine hydroxylase-related dioxygenase (phytanoyl-CoA dioxygenase family)